MLCGGLAADDGGCYLDAGELAAGVKHQRAGADLFQRAQQEVAACAVGCLQTFRGKVAEGAEDGSAVECFGFHGLTHRDGEGVRDFARKLGKEAAAVVGEDAAPQSVHVDGDDGGVGAAGYHFHASADGREAAAAGELSLREDADEVAFLNSLRGAQDGFAWVFTGDGQGVEDFQHPAEHTHAHEFLCHDETHGARADHGEEEGIRKGNVVHNEQGAASLRNAINVHIAGAVEEAQHPDAEHADKLLRNETQGGDEDESAHQEQDEELRLRGGSVLVHEPDEDHGYEPHEVVDEVAGGNDAAAVGGVAVVLKVGVERSHEDGAERAGESKQGVAHIGVDIKDGEQQGAEGDAQRAQGDEPQLILAAAEQGGNNAAGDDTAAQPGHQNAALHTEVNRRVGNL